MDRPGYSGFILIDMGHRERTMPIRWPIQEAEPVERNLLMCPKSRFACPRLCGVSVLAVGFLGAVGGCGDPGVEFRGFDIQQADFRPDAFEVDFAVRFRLNNPFGFPLIILPHQVSFTLKSLEPATVPDRSLALTPELPPGGVVPAHGHADLKYQGELSVPLGQELEAFCGGDVKYELLALIDFNPTPWGPQNLELRYANEVRIPRAPEVALRAGEFGIDDFEIVFHEEAAPLAFVDDGGAGTAALNVFLAALDVFLPADLKTIAHCAFGRNDAGACTPFVTGIDGVSVHVPLIVRNPNRYSIRLPNLNWTIAVNNSDVLSLRTVPEAANVAANGSRNVTLTASMLVPPGISLPRLEGSLGLDLGYGLWRIPLAPP